MEPYCELSSCYYPLFFWCYKRHVLRNICISVCIRYVSKVLFKKLANFYLWILFDENLLGGFVFHSCKRKRVRKITLSVCNWQIVLLVPEDGNNTITKKEKTCESDWSCYLPLSNLRLFFICYTNAWKVTALF